MLRINLDDRTHDIVYGDDPYDGVCREDIREFIEELKEILEKAEILQNQIRKRDQKVFEDYLARYPEDGETIFSMVMAGRDLAFLREKYPDSAHVTPEIRDRMNYLIETASGY